MLNAASYDYIRYGIDRTGLAKCPQSQNAAFADAAGLRLTGIA